MLKDETVERALQAIEKGYAEYQYFFDNLKSPAWLQPLADRGRFRQPPPPVREGQYISFPLWPESRYLVRMAGLPEAQAAVLEIALRIPATENSRVHDDLADIALALQPPQSAKLVPQACEWVQAPIKLLLADKIGKLVVHLAEGGQGEAALTLVRAALALGPDPRAEEAAEEPVLWPEPKPRFQTFYYERIVDAVVPVLVEATGLSAVHLFSELLDDFITFSRRDSGADDEDFLENRQAAIEAGRDAHDIASTLLCAVRDTAELVIRDSGSQFQAVIEVLQDKQWCSFRRLELHLTRLFPQEGHPIAEEFFRNPASLDRRCLRHEAILLLKSSFATLRIETQERILAWMHQGPPEEAVRHWLEFIQRPATDENIRAISDQWRRDWFATLEGQLPESYQRKLADLKAGLGEGRRLEEPDRINGGAIGPQSPKSVEEFAQMGVDEFLSFLVSWTPGNDIFSPTAEGAGRSLATIVTQRPNDFAVVAHRFKEVDPTYVRSLLTGLTEAIKQDKAFEWRPVLELTEWIINQPRDIPNRKRGLMVADPDWGWTRDAIIDLLSAGFDLGGAADRKRKPGRFGCELRSQIWQTLKPLTADPNPSLSDETGPHFDPASLSINSIRGRAFHALMEYAWWVRQCTDEIRKSEGKLPATFVEMPEVREVLDAHLDLDKDPTLTIRSVYGHSLSSLATLDRDWLQSNLNRILPAGKADPPRFAAAWESFVVFNHPNATLLTILLPAYQHAVRQIGRGSGLWRGPASPEDRLADHLMVYYWLGKLDFGSSDGLIDGFYDSAPDDLRAHAMWFVGRSVPGWGDSVPSEAFDRLRKLAERRLKAAMQAPSPDDFAKELAEFGYWFVSGKFEERWALETLLSALRLTKKSEAEMDVVKRLAELCPRYPVECVSCLRLMVEGDREGWLLVGVEDSARQVLGLALRSNNAEACLSARRLTEELIARGHFGFRTLSG